MSDKSLLFGNQPAPAAQPQSPAAGLFGDAPPPAAAHPVKDVTTASFAAEVIQESRRQPVLVDFWAPWCGPCKQLAPALEKAVAEARGRVRLVKMNIDEHPSIAGQLGIQSIPAVIAFKNGQPVDGFMGAVPESQIKEFIARVAGNGPAPELGDAIKAAQEALAQGDIQTAMQLFDAVLSQAPDNLDAIAGLAGILYDAGDAEAAQEVLAMAPEGKGDHPALASLKAKMALAAEAAKLGDPAALQQKLVADPNDHQARFDLAMIQNALGNRAEAAESLLAVVKADRAWNEDGARAQLLRFFEAWGPTDPATLSARRRLSSLLFS
ncbi:MAG: thioredoxin [Methylobacterium mesophilicum]|nr:thioredoxin [Methylobacterium mesophilicum]